jgi:hypothetical protein
VKRPALAEVLRLFGARDGPYRNCGKEVPVSAVPQIISFEPSSKKEFSHTLAYYRWKINLKGRLPAAGMCASHPESDVDADSCTRSLLSG